ncbi:MAG: hypothetical protein IT430_04040 [Phycisphaerales bacterium]|nr:hypothetical protein [Phycisphaerales bacterium]
MTHRLNRLAAPAAVVLAIGAQTAVQAQCLENFGVVYGSQSVQSDGFGESIAVDGSWMAVGAPFTDGNAVNTGVVYMYHRDGAQWSEHSIIMNPMPREQDQFGRSVSVSGNRVLIAIQGADLGADGAGAAAVYALNGSRWQFQGILANPTPRPNEGLSMQVLLDGDDAYLGFSGANPIERGEGAVQTYHFNGAQWEHVQTILLPNPQIVDAFGSSLSKSGDRLLIGAFGYDANDINTGAAFVYRLDNGQWVYEALLAASDGAFSDLAGRHARIGGEWAILDAAKHNSAAGAAYVFKRVGETWTEHAKIESPDPASGNEFAADVALDGDLIVVGEPDDSHAGAGRAFRYRLTNDEWLFEDRMRDIDTPYGNDFGRPVVLTPDTLVIGGSGVPVVARLGNACIYDRHGRCGPVLSVEAECSVGQFRITVRWERATPNGRVALLHASDRGFFYVPGNLPCAGTWLGLGFSGARVVYQTNSGPNGGRVLDGLGTREVCGTYLQLLDLESCLPSNVVRLDRAMSW